MKLFLAFSAVWIVLSTLGYSWVRYDITALEHTYEHYLTSSGFELIKPAPKTSYSSVQEAVDDVTSVVSDAMSLPDDEFRTKVDSHFGSAAIAQQSKSLLTRLSIAWFILTILPIMCGIILLLHNRKWANHRPPLTGDARDMMLLSVWSLLSWASSNRADWHETLRDL